jgi:hypothetical protein
MLVSDRRDYFPRDREVLYCAWQAPFSRADPWVRQVTFGSMHACLNAVAVYVVFLYRRDTSRLKRNQIIMLRDGPHPDRCF